MPQQSRVRSWLHSVLPAHFESPIGLAWRLVQSRNPVAYFAMFLSAIGLAVRPIDLLLYRAERRRYENAPPRKWPLLLIVGSPRSGTTLCQQLLLRSLPFAYFPNLTSLFPRAPLMGCRILGAPKPYQTSLTSFYGKTLGWGGPNDGLYLWDRWLGRDRTQIPVSVDESSLRNMRQFFAACEAQFQRPILNKMNNLVAIAHLIEEALKPCHFICMQRSDLPLAQSLYEARRRITGRLDVPYGLQSRDFDCDDPIESVCQQVMFYKRLAQRQQQRLGKERFWIVSYEEMCDDPLALIDRVHAAYPQFGLANRDQVQPLSTRPRLALEPGANQSLNRRLQELNRERTLESSKV